MKNRSVLHSRIIMITNKFSITKALAQLKYKKGNQRQYQVLMTLKWTLNKPSTQWKITEWPISKAKRWKSIIATISPPSRKELRVRPQLKSTIGFNSKQRLPPRTKKEPKLIALRKSMKILARREMICPRHYQDIALWRIRNWQP